MGRFGQISKHYHVYKQAGNERIKNGNRVFQFSKLTNVPPTSHLVQGRIVRIVYSKNIHQDFCSDELWRKITKDYLRSKDWAYDSDESSSDEEASSVRSRPTKITFHTTSSTREINNPSFPANDEPNDGMSITESVPSSPVREKVLVPPLLDRMQVLRTPYQLSFILSQLKFSTRITMKCPKGTQMSFRRRNLRVSLLQNLQTRLVRLLLHYMLKFLKGLC